MMTDAVLPVTLKEKVLHTRRVLATFLLVFSSIQYVPIEGWGYSWFKIIVLFLSPLMALGCKMSIAGFLAGLFYGVCCLTSYLHPYPVSIHSLVYFSVYLIGFSSFHTLLSNGAFEWEYFEAVVTKVISAFIIVLILQQAEKICGFRTFPILNDCRPLGFRFSILSLEPSFAARIMGAYCFAWLELMRMKYGKMPSIRTLSQKHRFVFWGSIYMFATMGSGTAWGVLVLLFVHYTCSSKNFASLLMIFLIFLVPSEQIESKERMVNVVKATQTLDFHNVQQADFSAASRVGIFFHFFQNFNPFSSIFWLGQGHYTWIAPNTGMIQIYGCLGWIFQLLLFGVCCFRKLFSYEVAFFCLFCAISIGSVANLWAIMMVFACVKYFTLQYEHEMNEKRKVESERKRAKLAF